MIICGIDEVGRGCLAGPVCSVALIVRDRAQLPPVKDSKLLTSRRRTELDLQLREVCWIGIGLADAQEIDELNILQATFLSMRRAVANLENQILSEQQVPKNTAMWFSKVEYRIDGRDLIPDFGSRRQKAVIGGDKIIPEISAASIVAKVYRDNLMMTLDRLHPQYEFCKHKGYGTSRHIKAISEFGILESHRKSFAPIRTRT